MFYFDGFNAALLVRAVYISGVLALLAVLGVLVVRQLWKSIAR